jgi:hypothetical protein
MAQAVDAANSSAIIGPLIQSGVLGVTVLWFMWRDGEERKRRDAREQKQDARIDAMVQAMNHLIQMTGIEVLTRPTVVGRVKSDAEDLLAAIKNREAQR